MVRLTTLAVTLFAVGWCYLPAASAEASPALVVEAASGAVLYEQDATQPWYPASLTKLMTLYVTLQAVHDHKIALDTPLVVSARAASMPPSKMGFAPGTEVTLDNALRMLMVRSANDLAITIAEGVSGSVDAFAEDMNAAAEQLGLHESHFVNPNGLPDPRHVSSARDMAILARALYYTFPDHADMFGIGALAFDGEVIPNHNNLLGRYPGAEGMKTGFTCPAGFNIVASAMHGTQRLIVVVMGAPSVAARTSKVSVLFDRGFQGIDHPIASLANLGPSAGTAAPDMRDQICRKRGKAVLQFNAELQQLTSPFTAEAGPAQAPPPPSTSFFSAVPMFHPAPVLTRIDLVPAPNFAPVPVFSGRAPGYIGPVAQARPPHSPVGTEPEPATASSYAASTPALETPLKPDPDALPIKGRHPRKIIAAKPEKSEEKASEKSAKPAHTAKLEKPAAAKATLPKDHPAKDHLTKAKSKTGKGENTGGE